MSKTTSSKQGTKVEYWPGTSIVKSTGNAFTWVPESVMATPQELVKATKQKNAETARKTQLERCNGFGGNTLKGLSKKAREQLAKAQPSITLEKRRQGIARHFKSKASI